MKKILVVKGFSEYNVLCLAIDEICKGFQKSGYEIEMVDLRQSDGNDKFIECLKHKTDYEYYFSMQGLWWEMARDRNYPLNDMKNIGWFVDAPVYHSARFYENCMKDAYVLMIQHSHTNIVRREYTQFKKVETLYHGGFEGKKKACFQEKDIDVFFSGTYIPIEEAEKAVDEIEGVFGKLAQLVKQRLNATEMSVAWEQELKQLLVELEFQISDNEHQAMLEVMYPLDQYQRSCMRHKMVECIVSKGLTLSVVGNGWDKYNGQGKEYLKILSNSGMDIVEVVNLMQKSKIVLNNINFEDGMHERVFTAMLAKAVCLTNKNRILDELFIDGKELITYSINKPQELPGIIFNLLNNPEKMQKIAEAGYNVAKEKHTWQRRGEQIIKWMENDENFVY